MATFAQHQARPSSNKVGLAVIEATQRVIAVPGLVALSHKWPCNPAGSFTQGKIVSISEDGVALTEAVSFAAMVASTWFHDTATGNLYVYPSDGLSPSVHFVVMKFQMFFATEPVAAPYDLASGRDVYWQPLLSRDSEFNFEIENSSALLGVAVSSASGIRLRNDRSFWDPIYDQVTFSTQLVRFYSWSKDLPITEAKLLYKGKISKSTYTDKAISFQVRDFLDELRAPVQIDDMSAYVGATIPDSLKTAKQRRLYGLVKSHVPTPIKQWLPTAGWQLTGTLSISAGSTALSGTSTSFLSELSPGDDLLIGDASIRVRIESVTSDSAAVLSAVFSESTQTAATAYVFPSHPKRYMNRDFLVAGHALARPPLEVTNVIDQATFYLDDTSTLEEGDIIEFSGQQTAIRVLGDGFVKTVDAFDATLSVGAIVYHSSVSRVYLDSYLLEQTRDFTYDATTAVLSLTQTAEFNVSPVRVLSGSVTFTSASRSVSGTNTLFRTELKPGAWVKGVNCSWREVLEIVSDTSLLLRVNADGSDAAIATATCKNPPVYEQGKSVVSCDALGKKDSDGNFIRYPGSIARDILIDAGLEDEIDEASFDDTDQVLQHRIGLAIPEKMADRKSPPLRDVLNKVCRSAFGGIVLNEDYQLQMIILEPSYLEEPTQYSESDLLHLPSVGSDSSQIIAAANINYSAREYDPASATQSVQKKRVDNLQYLAETEKELSLDTYLLDEDDSEIMASRWAFLLSKANSDIKIAVKIQASRAKVFDILELNHEKLYYRVGSDSSRVRIGAIASIKKKIDTTEILINDLGNAFSRCARITEDSALDFDDADDDERLLNGYMTDTAGITDESVEINLIW